jgi:transposase InsO family protein
MEKVATGPCQVWSWDITYLKCPITGEHYYLYLIVDVWSRMIVGYIVHDVESMEFSSELLESATKAHSADNVQLVLHSDNGTPMKGSTMKATMERLGVIASFSRPHVSDDNPYSESLFRTLKYRPNYPNKPFESLTDAQAWTDRFVAWYNTEHLHSAIAFVTPETRHYGRAEGVMEQRRSVYEAAKQKHPERWGKRSTRKWQQPSTVVLNPQKLQPMTLQNPIV